METSLFFNQGDLDEKQSSLLDQQILITFSMYFQCIVSGGLEFTGAPETTLYNLQISI